MDYLTFIGGRVVDQSSTKKPFSCGFFYNKRNGHAFFNAFPTEGAASRVLLVSIDVPSLNPSISP